MATFKNDEDDATFWNRLITDEQRAAAPERKKASATGEEGAARGGGRRGDGAGKGVPLQIDLLQCPVAGLLGACHCSFAASCSRI